MKFYDDLIEDKKNDHSNYIGFKCIVLISIAIILWLLNWNGMLEFIFFMSSYIILEIGRKITYDNCKMMIDIYHKRNKYG